MSVDEAFAILRAHARRTKHPPLGDVAHAALTDPASLAALSDALPDPADPDARSPGRGSARPRPQRGRGARTWRPCWGAPTSGTARRNVRDRAAEERVGPDAEDQSRLDRIWAGRDRDSSMVDRADLMDLLNRGRPPTRLSE